jgi:hypothetical protein
METQLHEDLRAVFLEAVHLGRGMAIRKERIFLLKE